MYVMSTYQAAGLQGVWLLVWLNINAHGAEKFSTPCDQNFLIQNYSVVN